MAKWIKENFHVIVFVFLILMFLKGCIFDNKKLSDIEKEQTQITTDIKSIKDSTYTKSEFDIRLRISGLESEKRMIQATDRKMLDVQRQNAIEQEILMWEVELDKMKKPN